jgi:glycosyltransferase involved in cell wall biosynthesis
MQNVKVIFNSYSETKKRGWCLQNLLLSVIIPVYNVENYLPKCIKSVLMQTYSNLEIVLVNDGSTDRSGQICENFKVVDERIKVIHKQNGGLSSARNAGLDVATGQLIAFLDSDDWIEKEMYEILINLLLEHKADIASCGFKEIYPNKEIAKTNSGDVFIFDSERAIMGLFTSEKIRFEVWNKVFTKQIIGNTRFKMNQIYEDVYFDKCIFLEMKKLVFIDRPLHNYLKVRKGNTNSKFKMERLCIFDELDEFIYALKKRGTLEAAYCIQAFALWFSIGLYVEAKEFRLSQDTLRTILERIQNYYMEIDHNPYINKWKSSIFFKAPDLYAFISQMKSKISKAIRNEY